jgi:hypothetical protein
MAAVRFFLLKIEIEHAASRPVKPFTPGTLHSAQQDSSQRTAGKENINNRPNGQPK